MTSTRAARESIACGPLRRGCPIEAPWLVSGGHGASLKQACAVDHRYFESLAEGLKAGHCNMSDVDGALTHTLKLRFELGLFDPVEDQPCHLRHTSIIRAGIMDLLRFTYDFESGPA
eukprot:COSAG01_NODE_27119_length_693_cov_10.632997_2_plen_117_part_00